MIDFRRYSTTAEKGITVMENAPDYQRASIKLLRHFYVVVLKSSTKFIVGIYGTFVFVNYLQRGLLVRVHWENWKKKTHTHTHARIMNVWMRMPLTRLNVTRNGRSRTVAFIPCTVSSAREPFKSNHRIVLTEVFEKDPEHFCQEIVIWSLLTEMFIYHISETSMRQQELYWPLNSRTKLDLREKILLLRISKQTQNSFKERLL